MKNNTTLRNGLFVIALATVGLQSCKKDPPVNSESEVITTLQIVATDSATGTTAGVFTFKDLDGDKPTPPSVFDTIKLAPNKTYNVSLIVLDESKNPIDSTSNEIAEEADDHLFFFESTPAALVNVVIQDKDSKNLPLGLLSKWTTGTTGSGTTRITLRHQPGEKNGTFSPGDTDIEVTFNTLIQ
jgi:hypothetical protein